MNTRKPLLLTAILASASPLFAAIIVDGTLDGDYGAALHLQLNTTGFGDNNTGQVGTANGSELDGFYGKIVGSNLHLIFTGNLESNFNKFDIFLDSQAGGQNTLSGGSGALANMNGLTFDTGFTADYFLSITLGNAGPDSFLDFGATGGNTTFLGGGTGLTISGSNGINSAINNSNTAGVDGSSVNSPGSVLTGMEFLIPLSTIGNPAGSIAVSAFINNGDHNYASNQVLGSLPNGTGNLGGDGAGGFTGSLSGVNFNNFAGDQFVTVPAPVPEPSTYGVVAGLAVLGLAWKKRRRS